MAPSPCSDDHQEEQPALALLDELGWDIGCGLEETCAPEGGSLGRRDRREVVGLPRLRAALDHLNAGQPPPRRHGPGGGESGGVPPAQGRRARVSACPARGGLNKVRLRMIAWDRPGENDCLAINQFTLREGISTAALPIWWASAMACRWW